MSETDEFEAAYADENAEFEAAFADEQKGFDEYEVEGQTVKLPSGTKVDEDSLDGFLQEQSKIQKQEDHDFKVNDAADAIALMFPSVTRAVNENKGTFAEMFGGAKDALTGLLRYPAAAGRSGMLGDWGQAEDAQGNPIDMSYAEALNQINRGESPQGDPSLIGEVYNDPTILPLSATGVGAAKWIFKGGKWLPSLGKGMLVGAGEGATAATIHQTEDVALKGQDIAPGEFFTETAISTMAPGVLGAAGAIFKKVGAKAFNALKGKFINASDKEIFDLGKKYGIDFTEADITGEGAATEKMLRDLPGVGMGGHAKKTAGQVQSAIKKESEKVNFDWDEGIQESLSRKSKVGRKKANELYSKVEELSGDASINPSNTIGAIDKTLEKFTKSKAPSKNPAIAYLNELKDNLGKGESSFSELRATREALGSDAKDLVTTNPTASKMLKDVRKSIDLDMDDLISKNTKIEKGNISIGKRSDPVESIDEFGDVDVIDGPEYNLLEKVFVNPEHRGKGVGRKLIEDEISKIKNNLPIRLSADPFDGGMNQQKLVKFYESLGFEIDDYVEGMSGAAMTMKNKNQLIKKSVSVAEKVDIQPKKGLKEAYKKAKSQFKKEVVPYKDRKILNALKSDTPDEIFNNFIKPKKGDRAANFAKLLDDKGRKALKAGFIDNAISGATVDKVTSPSKLAGYLERLSKPAGNIFKGSDLTDIKDLAKVMRHAEKYGQLNESPSNGMALIPYIKGIALGGAGYSAAFNPVATGASVLGMGVLAKLTSFMKTKGVAFSLASAKEGSEGLETALTEFIDGLSKVSSQTARTAVNNEN